MNRVLILPFLAFLSFSVTHCGEPDRVHFPDGEDEGCGTNANPIINCDLTDSTDSEEDPGDDDLSANESTNESEEPDDPVDEGSGTGTGENDGKVTDDQEGSDDETGDEEESTEGDDNDESEEEGEDDTIIFDPVIPSEVTFTNLSANPSVIRVNEDVIFSTDFQLHTGFGDADIVLQLLVDDAIVEVKTILLQDPRYVYSTTVVFNPTRFTNPGTHTISVAYVDDPSATISTQIIVETLPEPRKVIFDASLHDASKWADTSGQKNATIQDDSNLNDKAVTLPLSNLNNPYIYPINERIDDYPEISWNYRLESGKWSFIVVVEDAAGDQRLFRYHGDDFSVWTIIGNTCSYGYGNQIGTTYWKQFVRNLKLDLEKAFPTFSAVRIKEFRVASTAPLHVDDIILRNPPPLPTQHSGLGLTFEYRVTSEPLEKFQGEMEKKIDELKTCLGTNDLRQSGYALSFQPPYNWVTPYFRGILNCRALGATIDYCGGRVDHGKKVLWLPPDGWAFKHELIHIYLLKTTGSSDTNHRGTSWRCQ